MAFGNFSPGSYTVTLNSVSLGLVNDPIRIQRAMRAQEITVDLYGDSVVDGVYRGGRVFVMIVLAEWTANIRAAIWQFNADFGQTGLHGRLLSDVAQSLVLTPVASTPAATLGNNTFTASKAILAPQNNVQWLMGNVHRNIPLVFEALAYLDGSNLRHFALS